MGGGSREQDCSWRGHAQKVFQKVGGGEQLPTFFVSCRRGSAAVDWRTRWNRHLLETNGARKVFFVVCALRNEGVLWQMKEARCLSRPKEKMKRRAKWQRKCPRDGIGSRVSKNTCLLPPMVDCGGKCQRRVYVVSGRLLLGAFGGNSLLPR